MKYLLKVYLIYCATFLLITLTGCNYFGGDLKISPAQQQAVSAPRCMTYTGTEILEWDPPSTYANGTPLLTADINWYTVYYGMDPGSYTTGSHVISDPTATGIPVSSVVSTITGTTYFTLTANNAIDGESGYSNEVCMISDN